MSIPAGAPFCIREVWSFNLLAEFELIRSILSRFPYISVDTEFPGVVLQPSPSSPDFSHHHRYHLMKANVDKMKLIQVGFTFTDENGFLPILGDGTYCAWQFNFRDFDLKEDLHHPSSIALLQKCGIDFQKNQMFGIDSRLFGELLKTCGLILNKDVHYICFHGAYDFAYLLKLITRQNLPSDEHTFVRLIKYYFGTFYDLKYMQIHLNMHGGLEKLATALGIQRIGQSHQAGSDSLLASSSFQKLKDLYFLDHCKDFSGVLFGIALPKARVCSC